MKNVALITGASSGIGKELARLHASKGGDLVVVARRGKVLNELKTELESTYQVVVKCISMDLTDPTSAQQLFDSVKAENIQVDYLMNNAGFGGHGNFHERDWSQDKAMIQLNVIALTELTRLFLPEMVARKSGKILNTASTAGFMPGPLQAVYFATKAYVVSFSQAIAEELRHENTNVTVTALCPGPVATEFIAAADLEGVDLFKNSASAESVALTGYNAMMRGKLIAINQWKLKAMIYWLLPFVPRRLVLKMTRQKMEKTSH